MRGRLAGCRNRRRTDLKIDKRTTRSCRSRRVSLEVLEQRTLLSVNPHAFFPVELFDAGLRPQDVAVGDLDGDGRLDVVTANFDSDSVSVLLNTGHGQFAAPVDLPVGDHPSSVALGDLNGDQELDMVAVNSWSNTVSTFLGNGDGTFQGPLLHDAGLGPLCVVLGDLNGDGAAEIVATVSWAEEYEPGDPADFDPEDPDPLIPLGNQVAVLWNDGNGGFGNLQTLEVGLGPASVALEDLDGDGDSDIVTANYYDDNVSVVLNNGDETFAEQVVYEVIVGAPALPECVDLGDVDGDGAADIVTANSHDDSVSVLFGNGDGTFDEAGQTCWAVGEHPMSVALEDFNGNGRQDIVTANLGSGDISVLSGRPERTLDEASTYGVGYACCALATGDVNGDGAVDIVGANAGTFFGSPDCQGTVSILMGNSDGTIGDGRFVDRITCNLGDASWCFATLGDVDGDDVPDLVTASRNDGTVSVQLGRRDGTFGSEQTYDVGAGPCFVALGDVNNDAMLDVVTANYADDTVSVLLQEVGGGFDDAGPYAVGNGPLSVALGDIDGNQRLDIVTANSRSDTVSVLLQAANGTFQDQGPYDVDAGPCSVALGDLDGHNGLDIVTANYAEDTVSVLLRNELGGFDRQPDSSVGDGPRSVALGDLNGDQRLDVVTADFLSNTVSVSLGDGTFPLAAPQDYEVGLGPYSLALGDLDGDGAPDIATANASDHSASVRWNNGQGQFDEESVYAVDDNPLSIALSDLNGDQALDIVTGNSELVPADNDLGDLDPGNPDDADTVSILLNRHLGKIDYRDISDVRLTEGDHWYRLQTVRDGFLTLIGSAAAGMDLTLYDADFNELGTSQPDNAPNVNHQRVDHPASGETFYYFRINVAADTEVDLCIANLVHYDPVADTLTVMGHAGEDRFEFVQDPAFQLTINCATYPFAQHPFDLGDVQLATFDGLGGRNTAEVHGSAGKDVATMQPTTASLTRTGLTVDVTNAAEIAIFGHGGGDVAHMHDSPGDDTFTADATGQASMRPTDPGDDSYLLEVEGFRYINGHASSTGGDIALLSDDPITADTLEGKPDSVKLYGPSFYSRALVFEQVEATATPGQHDWAYLDDSAGDDNFVGGLNAPGLPGGMDAVLSGITPAGHSFYNAVGGFRHVDAYASTGDDVARLYDSDAQDTFKGSPTWSVIYNIQAAHRANGFPVVHGFSTVGDDTAHLYGLTSNTETDEFIARPTQAKLSNSTYYTRALDFRYVHAHSNGGPDIAHLFGSAGDDVFIANPTQAKLYDTNFYNRALGFPEVHAYYDPDSGNDVAHLRGSAGDDAFEADADSARLSGTTVDGPFDNTAHEFPNVYAQLKEGNDTATLTGQIGNALKSLDGGPGDDLYVLSMENTTTTLVDSGGVDTFDFSHQDEGIYIELDFDPPQMIDSDNILTLDGTFENVIGTPFDDSIGGNGADNCLWGGAGFDAIDGFEGDDILFGEDGDDWLWGEGGSDQLYGGQGNDRLQGLGGNDVLDGGAGSDQLWGSSGNDVLHGGAGDDSLFGDGGDDSLDGGAGSDLLSGSTGNNQLAGGAGNDTYEISVTGSADTVDESPFDDGIDTLDFSDATVGVTVDLALDAGQQQVINVANNSRLSIIGTIEKVIGTDFEDVISGNGVRNFLFGEGGNDFLEGRGGNDVLVGGEDDDLLSDDSGDNQLVGRAGNDTYRISVTGGSDTVDESPADDGTDTLDFSAAAVSVSVDLALDAGEEQVINAANNSRLSITGTIENAIGTNFDDTILGNAADNILEGGAGNDTLDGREGADQLAGGPGDDQLLGGPGNDQLDGGADNDVLAGGAGEDLLDGGTGNDQLSGDGDNDSLAGGDGDDLLDDGAGDDQLAGGRGNDTYLLGVAGGTESVSELPDDNGVDTLDFSTAPLAVTVDLANGGAQPIALGNILTLAGTIENVVGTPFDDVIDGNAADNNLQGGAGNDSLFGAGGNDTLGDGPGDDVLLGGAGSDTYQLSVTGGADTVDESPADNGVDTLDFSASDVGVAVDLMAAGPQPIAAGNTLTLIDTIENVIGTPLGDTINGNLVDNVLVGGKGNDLLNGLAGADDTLIGGPGDDTYELWLPGGAVTVDESPLDDGIDTLQFSVADAGEGVTLDLALAGPQWITSTTVLTIIGTIENVNGTSFDDLIRGNAADNVLNGLQGSDILLGRKGLDQLVGGDERDILIGGPDSDILFGEADDDILIGGTTDYDANDAALLAILAEWTSANSIDDRINHLAGGGGLNDPWLLRLGVEVHDDGATDTLTGGPGADWFFLFPGDNDTDRGPQDRPWP